MKSNAASPGISLVITTYNWPKALEQVLTSVKNQQVLPLEVVIADDGSENETREMITHFQKLFPCPIQHIWHPDNGYQGSKIRNKAVMASKGDYIIFVDGDCLMRPDFVKQHIRLAKVGYFVAGNRILMTQIFTKSLLDKTTKISDWKPFSFTKDQVNRRWSLLQFPLGIFRKIRFGRWQGVKTCNMSLWRSDFYLVDGFDERYRGWGYEDSDLIVRLIRKKLRRLSGRFAVTVVHLWHPTSKTKPKQGNWGLLEETINGSSGTAIEGVSKYNR
jgi:glycosyltransferase involved in cell wall biosynthesis